MLSTHSCGLAVAKQAHFFLFLFSSFPMGWPPLPVGLGCPLPFYLLSASMEDPVTALVLDGPLRHLWVWKVLNECVPQELWGTVLGGMGQSPYSFLL